MMMISRSHHNLTFFPFICLYLSHIQWSSGFRQRCFQLQQCIAATWKKIICSVSRYNQRIFPLQRMKLVQTAGCVFWVVAVDPLETILEARRRKLKTRMWNESRPLLKVLISFMSRCSTERWESLFYLLWSFLMSMFSNMELLCSMLWRYYWYFNDLICTCCVSPQTVFCFGGFLFCICVVFLCFACLHGWLLLFPLLRINKVTTIIDIMAYML